MSTLQFQSLILIIAGWVNRTQQDVIEYLEAENRVLREQLGDGRLLLTDGQRRRLAVRAKAIGRLLAHYGLDNELIEKVTAGPKMDGTVACRERLGGILNYYYRRAA